MEMGERSRRLLRGYRRPDDSLWIGAEIERATNGRVSRFYVSRLRRGIIKNPNLSKIAAISEVMGISLETWIEEL